MPAGTITAKPKTGKTGPHDAPRKVKPGPKATVTPEFASAYERSRVDELTARAGLYKLKLKRMQGELLDRKLLVGELTAAFGAIREIILGSKLSAREKADCLRNLAEIPVLLDNVAEKQKAGESETFEERQKNGHSDL